MSRSCRLDANLNIVGFTIQGERIVSTHYADEQMGYGLGNGEDIDPEQTKIIKWTEIGMCSTLHLSSAPSYFGPKSMREWTHLKFTILTIITKTEQYVEKISPTSCKLCADNESGAKGN